MQDVVVVSKIAGAVALVELIELAMDANGDTRFSINGTIIIAVVPAVAI
jgi:hypothetical protein